MISIRFLDIDHKRKFNEFMKGAEAREKNWQAALFILSSPLFAKRCDRFIMHRKILFSDLLRVSAPWSSSEKALVKLAAALFNNCWKIDINDIFWNLDENNTRLVLEALRIRFC